MAIDGRAILTTNRSRLERTTPSETIASIQPGLGAPRAAWVAVAMSGFSLSRGVVRRTGRGALSSSVVWRRRRVAVLRDLIPGGVGKRISAAAAARVLEQAEPCGHSPSGTGEFGAVRVGW